MKLLEIISVNFITVDRLLITYSAFIKYLKRMWECNEAQHQLLTSFKKPYDLVTREILYILSEPQISMKLDR